MAAALGIPPAIRNHREPTDGEFPTFMAASSLDILSEEADVLGP